MKNKTISGKQLAWLLTAVYFASYVTRINFAAIIQEIVTDLGYEKTALSIVLVVLSITYGVGQIVNGWLGDKIKPENLIFYGLCITTVANILFPFAASSVPLMSILWGINGFAQAMMWPPIVKILVSTADPQMYNYSVVRISWGSSFGTIIVYLTAPLIISLVGWKAVFYASAIVGAVTSMVWFILKSRIKGTDKTIDAPENTNECKEKFAFPRDALFSIIFIAIAIILQGMLRDGISSWMPSYLSEVFKLENEASILLTVTLAIFSIICFTVSGELYKRFFENEVMLGGIIFAVSAVAALLLYIFFGSGIVISVILMMLINGCMHGINLMLITHVPKRFKKYGNISTISGLINCCTYIGAAISTYGIALLSDALGWRSTIGVWFIIAALGFVCCTVAYKPWQKFYKK